MADDILLWMNQLLGIKSRCIFFFLSFFSSLCLCRIHHEQCDGVFNCGGRSHTETYVVIMRDNLESE